jgi:protocatechuate 3,4-dioxygenase beta subunit
MTEPKKFCRRELTRQFGVVAGAAMVANTFASSMLATPAQVEGPFHPIDNQADTDLDLSMIEGHTHAAEGEAILVSGRVFDTRGRPLKEALVDVWQANHLGRYSHRDDKNTAALDPNFQGWGLLRTDAQGQYALKTIKPGPYPLSFLGEDGWRCRHIHFKISQPGVESLTTQMYFEGDPLISQDLEVAKVPQEQRHMLIAKASPDAISGLPRYRFDIYVALATV